MMDDPNLEYARMWYERVIDKRGVSALDISTVLNSWQSDGPDAAAKLMRTFDERANPPSIPYTNLKPGDKFRFTEECTRHLGDGDEIMTAVRVRHGPKCGYLETNQWLSPSGVAYLFEDDDRVIRVTG